MMNEGTTTKEATMSTHRAIQISVVVDTCESRARVSRRAACNLARIGNDGGAGYYLRRAARFDRIANVCRARLAWA